MLTRTMKEIWLFGGLDTLTKDHEGVGTNGLEKSTQRKMEEDVRVVEEGLMRFLEKYETAPDLEDNQQSAG